MHQPVDDRSLAHFAAPDEDELGFVERTPLAEIVVKNLAGFRGRIRNFLPRRPQDFRREAESLVLMQIKFL